MFCVLGALGGTGTFLGLALVRHEPPWYAPWAMEPIIYWGTALASVVAVGVLLRHRRRFMRVSQRVLYVWLLCSVVVCISMLALMLFVPY